MRMGLGGWKERGWLLVGGRPACEPCERLQQDLCCIHRRHMGSLGRHPWSMCYSMIVLSLRSGL